MSAAAVTTNVVQVPPTLRALIDSPDPVAPGGTLTLTADGVADANGDAVTVWFYRESNGVAGLQADDALLGPAGAAGGYALNIPAPAIPARAVALHVLRRRRRRHQRGNVVSSENTVAEASPLVRVQQVFVNGTGMTGAAGANPAAFRAAAGVDSVYGYAVPAGAEPAPPPPVVQRHPADWHPL